MPEKKLRGFLIDPKERTIKEVSHGGGYKEIQRLIEASPFTAVQIDDVNCVYVDDEGLLNNPRYFFTIKDYHQPLAGKGLILGVDEAGETISSSLELEEVLALIGFAEYSVQGWKTEEGYGEIMPGMIGFQIKQTPIFGPPDAEDDHER